jgi:hypothetical protein
MSDPLSRRDALTRLALLAGAVGLGESLHPAAAASRPHLSPDDPTAQAVAYHDSATQVDARQFPSYRPEQRCETCLQLQGPEGEPWRACNIFPGHLVNAAGWCRVWVAKS